MSELPSELLAQLQKLSPEQLDALVAQVGENTNRDHVEYGDTLAGNAEKTTGVDQRGQQVQWQVNVAKLYQTYQTPPGRTALDDNEFEKILEEYLDWVKLEYSRVRLLGAQKLQEDGAKEKELQRIYTSLIVKRRAAGQPDARTIAKMAHGRGDASDWRDMEIGREETQPLDMADLLTIGDRVAIVGGAGSGKTTYLAFVAATLAGALRGQTLDVRLKPPRPAAALPVPLLAPLRFWQIYRECCDENHARRLDVPAQGSLRDFLFWYLRGNYLNFAATADFFERLLRGRGCLIMFDGLDEVVNVEERKAVRGKIERLLRSQYPGNACLVTARAAGYRDAPFGEDFARCEIEPMDEAQVAALARAWCAELYPQPREGDNAHADLMRAIKELNAERKRRGQAPLITSPLLVTMVVSVKYSQRELPRERAALYDACVDVVLRSEHTGREDDEAWRRLRGYGGAPAKQREWLALLAFEMQRGGKDAGASLSEQGVRDILLPVLQERGEEPALETFIAALHHRGGLFEPRGERFQFMHLTFQEYLAAQYLAQQWGKYPELLPDIVADEWWRETLLLTLGCLDVKPFTYDQRRAFIAALCGIAAPLDASLAAAELAAAGLGELTKPEPALLELARQRLIELLDEGNLRAHRPAPKYRAAAARALAVLGDPRDYAEMITIPAGEFLMGSDDYDDEKPPYPVYLSAYRIGKYPVTNAQYLEFVAATGRKWDGLEEARRPERRTCPARYVSWYDAVAYCNWRSAREGLTPCYRGEGKNIECDFTAGGYRLPTEAEWERAARGPLPSPSQGEGLGVRVWPWGDTWDATKCNARETGLGDTTPVGIFPDGASPDGCLDMMGNVWEWCGDWYAGDYYKHSPRRDPRGPDSGSAKVIRGGSWDYDANNVRAAYRYLSNPTNSNDDLGLRCLQ